MDMKKKLLFCVLLIGNYSFVFSQTNILFLFHRLPEEKTIELPGRVKLNYVEQGFNSGIPVIFLHGYTDSWHSFETVLLNFPRNIHAYAISQRGHGNSDRPDNGYSNKDFAADVAAFVKELKLGPVIIVGHSMGGMIAQRFALDYPELTRALVIAGSTASFKNNEGVVELVKTVQQLSDPVDPDFASEFQKSTIITPIPDAYFSLLVGESLKVPARVWKEAATGIISDDYSDKLIRMDKPTLIIWGDKDIINSRADQDFLQKSIKGSMLIVYEGIGHAVHWERPQRFSKDLVNFINTLDTPGW